MTDVSMIDLAMGWYTPATWRELRAIPEAKITMSYSQFARKVERMTADYRTQGINVVKFPINVAEMVAWCRKHGYAVDSHGRAVFGAALAAAHDAGRNVMDMPFTDRTREVH
jgi:hypothetical protein